MNRFVTEDKYHEVMEKQLAMTSQTLAELRRHGIKDGTEKKLEYFFYTDTQEKADALAKELGKLNYQVEMGKAAEGGACLVTGWTISMNLSDTVVMDWTRKMVDLGFEFDCSFDGWGTDAG